MFIKLLLHKEHCLDSIIRLKHSQFVIVNQLIMKVSRMINNESSAFPERTKKLLTLQKLQPEIFLLLLIVFVDWL